MKGIMKRVLIAAVPLLLNEARQYMKHKKSFKKMQQMNMAK
jgi:hypothetical protein